MNFSRTTAYAACIATGVFLSAVCWLAAASFASAYVASSTNYRIQNDSVSIGGALSTSTNYKAEDTLGETGTGTSTSAAYKLRAGYQQMQTAYLSISAASDISMPALTINQDTSAASTTWTVTTDNAAGYTLDIRASASPALVDGGTGESFTDYTEQTPGVKEQWSVTGAYEFGFSAIGADTTGYGTDTQGDCVAGANVPSAELLWEGFDGTTDIEMASSSSAALSGAETALCVATEQNGVFAPSGNYAAALTVTAISQ